MEDFPKFIYHPDPVATGAVVRRDAECVCCGLNRGYIYVASVYALGDYRELICPWCIADGSASTKLGAGFYGGAFEALPAEVWDEVNSRTPGYISWQSENWAVHCGDACEFHGDVAKQEIRTLPPEAISFISAELQLQAAEWAEFTKVYEPGGDPAIYKFVCRHCGQVIYNCDFS